MNFISLCAGVGERMKETIPKSLLPFGEKSIIMYQIEYARWFKMNISVVTGFRENLFNFDADVTKYVNPDFAKTNMVGSLMTAVHELNEDSVVSYGDIVYDRVLLRDIRKTKEDFVVAVDDNWKHYWFHRYGAENTDLETLKLYHNDIMEIGKKTEDPDEIDGRFIGLMKFSKQGLAFIKELCNSNPAKWKKAFSTDLLQELIDRGFTVKAMRVRNGWLEFDTGNDYLLANKWLQGGQLSSLLSLSL